jgi:hypothetical protein
MRRCAEGPKPAMYETPHAYPRDLVAFVRQRWPDDVRLNPPGDDRLERLVSTAYQASLLRDEGRVTSFRLLVARPESLPEAGHPPMGLHRLRFQETRPFEANEIRSLTPAAKYHRALIGVSEGDEEPAIWGLVQSGPRWLQASTGGRVSEPTLPRALVIRVSRPGHVAVALGNRTIAELSSGRLTDFAVDVFESKWLPARFATVRGELEAIVAEQGARATPPWRPLDPSLVRSLSAQMFKRVIATIRAAHHGGTVLLLPPECAQDIANERFVRLKYAFIDEEPRRRYRTLVTQVLTAMAKDSPGDPSPAGWETYRKCQSSDLGEVDEAIFEVSHLLASLAEVDGAVVLTKRFEILGFGGEIAGDLAEVDTVQRALDLEGIHWEAERVDEVGTRHRSAYRLCARFHDALAVVISQDGSVRFIAWHAGGVTYWDHASIAAEG